MWYQLTVTTPTGACDGESEAGSVVGNFTLDGDTGDFGSFNQTFYPGKTLVPKVGSWFSGGSNGALFPGDYDFKTEVGETTKISAAIKATTVETAIADRDRAEAICR